MRSLKKIYAKIRKGLGICMVWIWIKVKKLWDYLFPLYQNQIVVAPRLVGENAPIWKGNEILESESIQGSRAAWAQPCIGAGPGLSPGQ